LQHFIIYIIKKFSRATLTLPWDITVKLVFFLQTTYVIYHVLYQLHQISNIVQLCT